MVTKGELKEKGDGGISLPTTTSTIVTRKEKGDGPIRVLLFCERGGREGGEKKRGEGKRF